MIQQDTFQTNKSNMIIYTNFILNKNTDICIFDLQEGFNNQIKFIFNPNLLHPGFNLTLSMLDAIQAGLFFNKELAVLHKT